MVLICQLYSGTLIFQVSFECNDITSKKKDQKWGLDKYLNFQKDVYQDAIEEPSSMLTELAVVDLNDFEKLPLLQEGDVIAYRVLELTSWTPELTSFRVRKVSHHDGSLEIKFAAFVDARCVKQSKSDAMPAVTMVA
nr:hypothetical protein [Tanacetum cinerariifolium]